MRADHAGDFAKAAGPVREGPPGRQDAARTVASERVGAEWPDFGSVRQTFPAADVFEKCVIFNIGGNKYRLIAAIHFRKTTNVGKVVEGRVYVRDVLTHAEYDKGSWKNDCKC